MVETIARSSAPGGAEIAPRIGDEVGLEPFKPGDGLPLFVTPVDPVLACDTDAAVAWLRDRKEPIDQLVCDVGAIVLRGFAFRDTAAFDRAVEHYPSPPFGYIGGATPRSPIQGRVYEATRTPAALKLQMHQEMAYLPHYPSKLAFFCNRPAETGGETLIADVRRFDAAIPRDFREKVKQRGVRYVRNFRAPNWFSGDATLDALHLVWHDVFATTDPRQAEAACRAMGVDCHWADNGSLSLVYTASGFITHPRTGQELWFNHIPSQSPNPWAGHEGLMERVATHAHLYGPHAPAPYATTFGDGSPIETAELKPIYALLESLEVAFPWRQGDLMLLDNFNTFHGRNAFTGTRDVQVALLG